ncbi:hypothetical protein T12_16295 [Trichinella patagoniensis]|uniref:Uncharacterized protein n=1 Tax=Trichinella patagoniensis TaxID=990121 RepID=A0A0V1AGB0_9BILA|nr:hypothetical protein T12_16295 [Trichinella patagoniensis]
MLSGKRESERKGNPPVNTGPPPFSDECANSAVEEKEASDSIRTILIQRADDVLIPVYVSRNTADVELRSSLLKPHLGKTAFLLCKFVTLEEVMVGSQKHHSKQTDY